MNERINELAEQASEYAVLNPSDMVLKSETEDVMLEIPKAFIDKFAELIVAECMNVVAKKCASPTAYNALAEHFGVEE